MPQDKKPAPDKQKPETKPSKEPIAPKKGDVSPDVALRFGSRAPSPTRYARS